MCLIKLDPLMDFDLSYPLRSPGDVLLNDHLRPRTMTLPWLARRTGISVSSLREIAKGERRINAEFAMRLYSVLDPTPAYWLVLQARYDLAVAGCRREGRRRLG
ncbi:HigA family addiction module antitoxin [Dyella sp. EPa41]|uniref:HigA family addiction module antitoxin n=1 Tax=Dyella sp. EPa41 TaxID=1561194 RepID=UPI001915138C|nr:HigA family addiction module antitoxin [Dyella sp. EPa41]